jgi:hypothetical protein
MAPSDPDHRFCTVKGLLFPKSTSTVSEVYEFQNDKLLSVSISFDESSFASAITLLESVFGPATSIAKSGERMWRGHRVTLTAGQGTNSPIAWLKVYECH